MEAADLIHQMGRRGTGHGKMLKRQFLELIPDRDEDLLEGLTGRRIEHLGAIDRGEQAPETEDSRDRTSPIAQAVLHAGGLGENRFATEPYAGPYMSEEQIREFGQGGSRDGGEFTYQASDSEEGERFNLGEDRSEPQGDNDPFGIDDPDQEPDQISDGLADQAPEYTEPSENLVNYEDLHERLEKAREEETLAEQAHEAARRANLNGAGLSGPAADRQDQAMEELNRI